MFGDFSLLIFRDYVFRWGNGFFVFSCFILRVECLNDLIVGLLNLFKIFMVFF